LELEGASSMRTPLQLLHFNPELLVGQIVGKEPEPGTDIVFLDGNLTHDWLLGGVEKRRELELLPQHDYFLFIVILRYFETANQSASQSADKLEGNSFLRLSRPTPFQAVIC